MEEKLRLRPRILTTLVIFTIGCAGMPSSRTKDEAAIGRVKTAAIVSYSAYMPDSLEIQGATSTVAKTSSTTNQIYNSLREAFSKKLGWKLLMRDQLTVRERYQDAYKKTMLGWQNKMPPPKNKNLFIAEGLMDLDSLRILGRDGRDKLLDDLKVDALIGAQVWTDLRGASVIGVGSRYPQSTLSFRVYVKGKEGPIWFEGAIVGDKGKESVGRFAFTDNERAGALALSSAKSAIEKIGKVTKN